MQTYLWNQQVLLISAKEILTIAAIATQTQTYLWYQVLLISTEVMFTIAANALRKRVYKIGSLWFELRKIWLLPQTPYANVFIKSGPYLNY